MSPRQSHTFSQLKPLTDTPLSPLSPKGNAQFRMIPYQIYLEARQDVEGMRATLLDEQRQKTRLMHKVNE